MRVFSKQNFSKVILHPNTFAKVNRKKAWAWSVGLGLASFGITQLVCYIITRHTVPETNTSLTQKRVHKHTRYDSSTTSSIKTIRTRISSDSKNATNTSPPFDIAGERWLEAQQLNQYFIYIGARFPKVKIREFLFDFSNIIPGNMKSKILETDFSKGEETFPFFMNVNGNHWTLILIDKKKRTVEYFDSMGKSSNYTSIEKQLNFVAEELSKKDPLLPKYAFIHKTNLRLQRDGYQCGVWVCYFLTKRLKNSEYDFDKIDPDMAPRMIAKYRKKVMKRMIQTEKAFDFMLKYKEDSYVRKYGLNVAEEKMNAAVGHNLTNPIAVKIKWLKQWNKVKKSHALTKSKLQSRSKEL